MQTMTGDRQRSNQKNHLAQLISGQSILHSELPLQSSSKKNGNQTVDDIVTVIPGTPEDVHLLAKATSDEKDVT